MHDPRYEKLARQLVTYSVRVEPGSRVLIDVTATPEAMTLALIREVRRAGGLPFVRISSPLVNREMLRGATAEQYRMAGAHQLVEMCDMNCFIALRGSDNITELSDVPAANMAVAMKELKELHRQRVNCTRWCVLRWPTPAMAQQAGMSTEAFADYYFDVCTLDYSALSAPMAVLKNLMESTDRVLITGPDTRLEFSIKDIPAMVCAGEYNIPDGEVFTAPVKESVEGVIRYNCPTIYQGIAFDEIELEFKQGKIVRAQSGAKTPELNAILDTDEGARYIGEFALGTNPRILHPMRDILFDEKIAGSFHFTPGQAYEVTPNANSSQVHWDLVCIQREDYGGGEMYFDNQLVRRNGIFIDPRLAALNPMGS